MSALHRYQSKRIVLGVTAAGSLRLMKGLPDFLVSKGWDVHVVCSDPPEGLSTSWSLHGIPMERLPSPARDLLSLGRWTLLLMRLRPDLVVVGTPKAGLLGTIAATLTLRPNRIYMLRGLRLSTARGSSRTMLWAFEKMTMLLATRIQAISVSLVWESVALGLAPATKFVVLGSGSSNGVDIPPDEELLVERTKRRNEVGLPNRPVVGYVGRLTADKGIDVLLEAYKRLRGRVSATLLIVGHEEPPGYLAGALASAGLDESDVHWVGPVADPSPYYFAMDVLCLPTKREGFGNVIIEAAAHGTPQIASAVTGCVDAVEDGVTGHLVPPDDVGAWVNALQEMLLNESYRARLGSAGRARVQREFTRRRLWDLIDAFYEGELSHRRRLACFMGANAKYTGFSQRRV